MDLHYRQEITVGTLVLTGVAAFVLGTMWLSGKESRSGKQIVNAQFTNGRAPWCTSRAIPTPTRSSPTSET